MEQKRGCKVFAGTRTFQVREIFGFHLYFYLEKQKLSIAVKLKKAKMESL